MDIKEVLLWAIRLISLSALGIYTFLMMRTINNKSWTKHIVLGSLSVVLLAATLFIKV